MRLDAPMRPRPVGLARRRDLVVLDDEARVVLVDVEAGRRGRGSRRTCAGKPLT